MILIRKNIIFGLKNSSKVILHFRHAERDKWIDVQKYDALESHVM